MSVSDLMAGLMMVFLLIAILLAKIASDKFENVSEAVYEWDDSENKIYEALYYTFKDDLESWDADIIKKTLTIRFNDPDVLFDTGEAGLKSDFKKILDDFVPRYVALLHNDFKNVIAEARIEGHTDSTHEGCKEKEKDLSRETTIESCEFLENMKLSQKRTQSVLKYFMLHPAVEKYLPWMRKTMSANGLSSSRLIMNNGDEDRELSRRVEFTVQTKSQEILYEIMNKIKNRKYF